MRTTRLYPSRARVRACRSRARGFPSWIVTAALCVLASLSCTSSTPEAPAEPNTIPRSEAELVDAFAAAFRLRDLERFEALLSPNYSFYPAQVTPDGTTHWGRDEEVEAHRRLFHPEETVPAPDPASWVTSIEMQCTLRGPFEPLYCDWLPCFGGLDPLYWRLTQADLVVSTTLHKKDGSSTHTEHRENFVVMEDRTKQSGDPGKYLLYRREDLGSSAATTGELCGD